MKYLRRIFLSLCLVLTLHSTIQSQDHGHDHGQAPEITAEEQNASELDMSARTRKAKSPFRGYGKFNRDFVNFCKKLALDGHADRFVEWVTVESETKRTDCRACQPLFRAFVQNCKKALQGEIRKTPEKKTPKAKEQESGHDKEHSEAKEGGGAEQGSPEASADGAKDQQEKKPKVPELEPHLEVLDAAVRLFGAIERDELIVEDSLLAVNRLLEVFQTTEGRSVFERSYFEILRTYIQAVFSGHTVKEQSDNAGAGSEDDSHEQVDLNELF